MVRAGAGERGGFGGASSRTVGSGHQAYRQTSKNSTLYSRNPPFLVWKSAPELGPEHSGTAVNRRLRARSIFLTVDASHAQCSGYMQPFPPVPRTFLRAVCAHAGRDVHRVCKRGVGPCARCRGGGALTSGAPRLGRFRSCTSSFIVTQSFIRPHLRESFEGLKPLEQKVTQRWPTEERSTSWPSRLDRFFMYVTGGGPMSSSRPSWAADGGMALVGVATLSC